ncbi:LuxR family transcriptional regulator [Methylobacterium nodulans]|uniref:Transcriptional regulator, LuxR family n=1 Tax=Methylobacterium nodulans (strain LMG 21967 / CNCM I-2342 / ORS 2060) TaxID=460265 RepID=B8IHX3_METNO|nr:LuxR family transcriptional regulator [Methylobacterium nodulans]ACL56011.1 transcriptional regulator, LuxR family [Methylobacterium nodulans ORS 2060]
MDSVRQATFDVIGRLQAASSQTALFSELKEAGRYFGYDSFIVTGLPHRQGENLNDCSLLVGWPMEWAKRYTERRYIHVDPVIAQIRRTLDPFMWDEAPYDRSDPGPATVMNESPSFGLNQGFCVPIHRIDGREAGVSFGASRMDLSDDARAGLHLVAIYAFSAARALSAMPSNPADPERQPPRCSAREIECMRWAAAGKTGWEISEILSLSQRTVEAYLNNAARKLGVANRVHLIAEAIRHGLID